MAEPRRYRKKPDRFVTAVQLRLEIEGFRYKKWGDVQTCKAGDWIVDNEGDVYTVAGDVFERTYERRSPGVYVKVARVQAWRAEAAGSIETREGRTHYEAGDYLVENEAGDVWAVSAAKFEEMYEPDESQRS
jgi:hypothetical protein